MKIRALCLHGFGGNGHVLKTDMNGFRDGFMGKEREVEWVFLDAPHPVETGGFCWWEQKGSSYFGLERSVRHVLDFVEHENEPLDVLVGVSQGGQMAAILCALVERSLETLHSSDSTTTQCQHPLLEQEGSRIQKIYGKLWSKILFIVAGNVWDARVKRDLLGHCKLTTPSMFVIGEQDELAPACFGLTDNFIEGTFTVALFGGAHEIPSESQGSRIFPAIFEWITGNRTSTSSS